MPKDQYMCQLCANHGIFNQPKKGHKQKCLYRSCSCKLCALNTKRRALDQMERQLKQTEEVHPAAYRERAIHHVIPQGTSTPMTSPSAVGSIFPSRVTAAPYCVALSAVMSTREYRFLKVEQEPTTPTDVSQKALNVVLEQIGGKSIFHSAEQLAG